MPQFDFSTYYSQIFWFTLCFAVLYLTVASVILPRIRDIIKNRKTVVDADRAAAITLEKQIANLHRKIERLQQDASDAYEDKIEETARRVNKEREQALIGLKNDLDQAAKKSRSEIKEMLATSEAKVAAAVQSFVQQVKTKILS